ncbi:hypothetical protein L1S35_12150 [Flavobacterium sp. AS60]|uniref:hypothetical protein n=1 Tax=Flavobacterium anseongense TaxID=2910677 RepID=UPI001F1D21AE|nr:hypothetical protein [Flavobacterium sp. AS60]MCF6130428.1 hypothetical protein [Flavobacterium sp. AS60]
MKMKFTLLFTVLFIAGINFEAKGQVDNTFTGENAGVNNTGNYNTGYGLNSLINNNSHSNSAFGIETLSSSSGGFNCAFGNWSLALNGSGSLNCSLGTRTLYNNVTGSSNIAIGHRSLEANISGNNNTAVGYAALLTNVGSSNTTIGSYSPRSLLSGDSNIFIGAETAINLLSGSNNVFFGNRIAVSKFPSTPFLAGNDTNQSIIIADGLGNQRIFIQKNGNTGIGLGNNVIPVNKLDIKGGVAIGRNFTPDGVTPGISAPANGLMVEGRVGIGTTSPNNKMEITHGVEGNSGLRFTNLTSNYTPPTSQVSNRFLTVNQNGDVVLNKMSNAVETNVLSSNANLMTSNVNSVSSSSTIINSISNTVNNNQLVTTVNGVASAPVNLTDISGLDASATNELQTLSQSGNTITLSNGGGSFTLPSFTDIPQTISQSGNTVTLSNGGGSFTLPSFTDTDAQSLALTGNTLSISNGNSVTLPTYVETPQTLSQTGNTVTLSNGGGSFTLPSPQAPQTLSQTGNTVTLSNGGGSFTLPTLVDRDEQTLSLTGNVLHISNGNSVVLPNHGPQSITQNGAIVTLSNGGGSITLQSTIVTAGNNVSILGNGTAGTPYVVSSTDTSLYADNGNINPATTVNGNRVVSMNGSNIWFNSAPTEPNGKIYIGSNASYPSTTGNYKLFVEGGILTEKVKVALRSTANWADYVFEKNYDLMPLKNVEEYIAKHKHLPGIDSASELAKNGLDLAEMQAKHMAKIEEMMLYIIEQNKTIEKNIKDIEALKKQVETLTANED